MTDQTQAATDIINEALAEENEKLRRQVNEMQTLLGRPINVNVQGSEDSTLRKIGEYLPQLGLLASNTATIGGQLMQAHETSKGILIALQRQNFLLERISAALEEVGGDA